MWVGRMSKEGEGSVWARGVEGRTASALGGLLMILPMVGDVSGAVSWAIGEGGCSRRAGAEVSSSSWVAVAVVGSLDASSEG